MIASKSHIVSLILLALAAIAVLAAREASADAWRSKVDPRLLAEYADSNETEFIILLDEQADLEPARQLSSKLAKGAFVHQTLLATAETTQSGLLAELSAWGIEHQSFWIVNGIWARADIDTLHSLALRQDVQHIIGNPRVEMQRPQPAPAEFTTDKVAGIEWNIELIGAPELWAESIDGRGAVIAGQDTGYDWEHSALKKQYRGWNGSSADHDYNWHDAIHSENSDCGANSPFPCDDYGHGTHTMGTMVGDDGNGNQIGVAPGARWIGCRNMEEGVGKASTYIECFQWFIAPTRIDGSDADVSMAPDVINNSWSCPSTEKGCDDIDVLRLAVEAVRAAGILTVQSAGNSGSACATISTPAAIYDASFTVGATNSADLITGFSSRGPVTVDSSYRLKPDIVAPGEWIRSSYVGGGYATFRGTSMAAPHVAGLVALLISADPALAGQVDRLEMLIQDTAVPKQSSLDCVPFSGDQIPNAVYGYGRIDAVAAAGALALDPGIWFPLIIGHAQPEPIELVGGK